MAAQLVLLHSPLVGPGTWSALAPLMRERGHTVSIPDYSNVLQGSPSYYEKIVRAACGVVGDGNRIVLVAHSGAGALVPAVAAVCKTSAAIFVDALLPHPGKAWFETIPDALKAHLKKLTRDGRVPPWHEWWPKNAIKEMLGDQAAYERFASELRSLPLAFFEEAAPSSSTPAGLRCAYLQLSAGCEAEAQAAERSGWITAHFPRHHLAMLTHPEDVAAELDKLLLRVT